MGGNFVQQDVKMIGFKSLEQEQLTHFGRTTEAKHLTEDNAWHKRL